MGWTFASFFGLAPEDSSTSLCCAGHSLLAPAGRPVRLPLELYRRLCYRRKRRRFLHRTVAVWKAQWRFGPGQPQSGSMLGIVGRVKPNLTLSFGLRYDRDTGRTDSDLPLPDINNFFPGSEIAVRNPNLNFAPQAGLPGIPRAMARQSFAAGSESTLTTPYSTMCCLTAC